MRFVLGPIPKSETVDPAASGWTAMTSSFELRWAKLALVVGMMSFLIFGFYALQRAASAPDVIPWFLVGVIASTLFLVPLHEFCHCLGYFVPLRSHKLIAGLCTALGACYVVYDSPLPRWRVLLMLAAPMVCLSFLPCLIYPFVSGSNTWALTYLVFVHASLCVGDTITFIRIYLHIPSGSFIHNCGWTTYWTDCSPQITMR